MNWLQALLNGLSADAAVVSLTVGIALIYIELNRPGWIVPGALGLLTVLLSASVLVRGGVNFTAAVLILSSISLLTVVLLRPTSMLLSVVATVALTFGLWGLRCLPAASCCVAVHMPVAAGCGLVLGAGTSVLAGIARRARMNKQSTGRCLKGRQTV